jgi:hypothetical protein
MTNLTNYPTGDKIALRVGPRKNFNGAKVTGVTLL